MIDNTLTWNSHIETFIPKVSVACFVVGAIKPFVTQDTLKVVYHTFIHLLIMGQSFGEIPHIATVFSNYERGLLKLSGV
jgi:hypothetical protein